METLSLSSYELTETVEYFNNLGNCIVFVKSFKHIRENSEIVFYPI